MKVFCLHQYQYRANILIPGNQYTVKYQHTVKYQNTVKSAHFKKQINFVSVDYFGLQTGEAGKPIT